ncbi:MAG: hypothetical protein GQ574_29420 [Crocinitomix sp.]|nr:hypothetical protein [Crocinitomix sp.]
MKKMIPHKFHLFAILLLIGFLSACNTDSAKEETNKNLEMPDRLVGVEMNFQYEEGNQYTAKFEPKGMSYKFHKNGKNPKKWNGPFDYNHLITNMNQHLVSWHEADKGDYVTLLINFESMTLYGSAILKSSHVHFQEGEIHKVND